MKKHRKVGEVKEKDWRNIGRSNNYFFGLSSGGCSEKRGRKTTTVELSSCYKQRKGRVTNKWGDFRVTIFTLFSVVSGHKEEGFWVAQRERESGAEQGGVLACFWRKEEKKIQRRRIKFSSTTRRGRSIGR